MVAMVSPYFHLPTCLLSPTHYLVNGKLGTFILTQIFNNNIRIDSRTVVLVNLVIFQNIRQYLKMFIFDNFISKIFKIILICLTQTVILEQRENSQQQKNSSDFSCFYRVKITLYLRE